jgi:transmembrane sensor
VQDDYNDSVKALVTRYLAGEASADEEKQVLSWIGQSSDNERQYLEFKKVFELGRKHYVLKSNEDLPINIDQEWNHFVRTVTSKEKPVVKLQSPSLSLWLKIAASLLIILVSGFVINYFTSQTDNVIYQTANNNLTVTLPDGSQVVLNKHSKLSYSPEFGEKDRSVTLEGEAFFNVKPDPQKTFIIQAKAAQVKVLGTSFDVKAYDSIEAVEVIVQTGIVGFAVSELKTEIKLTTGQKGIYTSKNQHLASQENDDPNFLSWNTQKIVFVGNDLRAVMETLNKIYQANIVIATDVPPSCEVTVTFDHQSLEAVLNVLKTTLNLTYRINGNQIEITHAGC